LTAAELNICKKSCLPCQSYKKVYCLSVDSRFIVSGRIFARKVDNFKKFLSEPWYGFKSMSIPSRQWTVRKIPRETRRNLYGGSRL